MQISNNINNFNNINFQSKDKKEKDQNKVGFKTMALAYMGGSVANLATKAAYQITIGNGLLKGMTSASSDAATSWGEILKDTIKQTNLEKKGVELIDLAKCANEEKAIEMSENLLRNEYTSEKLSNFLLNNPLTKIHYEKELRVMAEQAGEGTNACLLENTNKILINSEKIGYCGFHEIGHALNKNFSKLGKTLLKARAPIELIPAILIPIALLTNKRTEENQPQNFWQKTTQFIKNNVGKLTALSFIPIITEEIMASHKGMKLAKGILDKNQLKKVAKANIFGALTYIGAAIVTGYAASLANKVRDNIVEKRQAKKATEALKA